MKASSYVEHAPQPHLAGLPGELVRDLRIIFRRS